MDVVMKPGVYESWNSLNKSDLIRQATVKDVVDTVVVSRPTHIHELTYMKV